MLDHINFNTAIVRVEDFHNIENLGIGCTPAAVDVGVEDVN